MFFDIADIGTPILMTPHRLEWHLKLGTRLALRLLQAVELPVRGHDPATGRGTHLDAHAQERGMDALLPKQGILLKFADLVSDLERDFARPLSGL